MTLKIKMQKSKDRRYQTIYSVRDGVETYLGTEKTLLEMKRKNDLLKGKTEVLDV